MVNVILQCFLQRYLRELDDLGLFVQLPSSVRKQDERYVKIRSAVNQSVALSDSIPATYETKELALQPPCVKTVKPPVNMMTTQKKSATGVEYEVRCECQGSSETGIFCTFIAISSR